MFLLILFIITMSLCIYEYKLHRYYKKRMEDEKLISYFSQARMQLMKMVYTGEISSKTTFFNIIIRATSYSIRALYLYNNKSNFKIHYNAIKEIMPYIVDSSMKKEFEFLTVEQKELFVNTIIRMLELHIRDNILEKLLFKLYLADIKEKMNSVRLKTISKIISTSEENRQKISYLNDISTSYNIPRYAYA